MQNNKMRQGCLVAEAELEEKPYHSATKEELDILTHFGENPDLYMNAVTPPVFMSSLHVYKTMEEYWDIDSYADEHKYIYGRASNPTTRILEKKIAQLEHGTRAAVFASGMAAATSAIMAACTSGGHIVCMRDCYQPVKRFLNTVAVPRLNMKVTYVKGTSLQEWEDSIQPNTQLFILESPATFVFTVVDLRSIAKLARAKGILTYIDNTCCTPVFQKPLDMGIDIVMHTMSKYIGGHSDLIGGVLVAKDDMLLKRIVCECREWFGGILGPAEAWLAMRGLRTLDARLQMHQKTANSVAEYLENNIKVKKVYYTGLSSHPQADLIKQQQTGHTGLLSFVLDASAEKAIEFVNALRRFGKGCSWGGFESLALLPLYHSLPEELDFLGMQAEKGLIRLHCGLEGAENLLEDLDNAFSVL